MELPLITRWSNWQPDYVIENVPDDIDATIVNSLERLTLTVEESATPGEQTIRLANDAHAEAQTEFSFEVTEAEGNDEEEGDPDSGDDSETTE